jgi:hypothetical protein
MFIKPFLALCLAVLALAAPEVNVKRATAAADESSEASDYTWNVDITDTSTFRLNPSPRASLTRPIYYL